MPATPVMPALVNVRDLLAFPGGDNASDTLIGGTHFNKTTLDYWNYTLYSNNTISNGSWCLVVFEPYTPIGLLPNGSFANVTWCYSAINPVGPRGETGVAFAAAFGLSLLLVLFNLNKHGRLFLPAETRFRPIGRRWQWYWGIFVCAAAMISLFVSIDVDRYYLPELPLVLNVFFWFLMQLAVMAMVWEAVRHWGSWKERQFVDPDPFALRQDDKRARFEFYAPLFFYLWFWLSFFMIVPRPWGPIEMQRSPDQTLEIAKPTASDARFKAAAFMLFVCWLTICVHLWHSIRHYNPRNRGVLNRTWGCIRYIPARFVLFLPLALVVVAYQVLVTFEWSISPLNLKGSVPAIYAGGYLPTLLIVIINCVHGLATPNEDRELQRQRRIRGDEIDRDLGITKKPAWWRRVNGEHLGDLRDRIARNVAEIGGGRATTRGVDQVMDTRAREYDTEAGKPAHEAGIEMGSWRNGEHGTAASRARGAGAGAGGLIAPYGGKSDRRRSERTLQHAAGLLFPNEEADRAAETRRAELTKDGPPPAYKDAERGRSSGRPGTAGRSNSTETTASITGPAQQVRSMLDV